MMWQISLGAARQFSPNNTGVPESSIMFAGCRMSTFCLPACAPGEDIVGQQLKLRFYCRSSCGNSDRDPGDHLALPPHGTAAGTERLCYTGNCTQTIRLNDRISRGMSHKVLWLKLALLNVFRMTSEELCSHVWETLEESTDKQHYRLGHLEAWAILTFHIAKIIIYTPKNSALQSVPNAHDSAIYI